MSAFHRVWRRARPFLSVAIITAGVVTAVDRRGEVASAWRLVQRSRWEWMAIAVVLELGSIVMFTGLQWLLLRWGGVRISRRQLLEITLAANAVALSVPAGAAVSARWSYEHLRQRGVERSLAAWTVLAAGALASFALFDILVTGAWVAGSSGPVAPLRPLATALAMVPVALVLGGVLVRRVPAVEHAAGTLLHRASGRRSASWAIREARALFTEIRAVRPPPAAWPRAFALATGNWLTDLGCLVAAILTVRGPVPWRGILVAYALAKLAGVLPVTPGGLAVVEGSLAAALVAYGMPSNAAVAATLLYRVMSFWAPVPIGWATYFAVRRQTTRVRGGAARLRASGPEASRPTSP
ncbi:MAG TPA: lysylphosphatidylglycerol synthase transmembrane domain-containing protein [Acidimicrobiales bacterium]|nr:lysylphosphatidylglycerol synthase transmembrane domain-containing protein [Acidimicrobiales bacterium]